MMHLQHDCPVMLKKLSYAPQIIAKQFRQLSRPARTGLRVFGVGPAKTGTHTLAQMFEDHVRSGHEADAQALIARFLQKAETGSPEGLHRLLHRRDRLRKLKIDSSSVNAYILDDILEVFPDSRFVLTIRSPGSWLRSMADHSIKHNADPIWLKFRTFRFGPGNDHPPEEQALAEAGLFPTARYLSDWSHCVGHALDVIPQDQLFVVKTSDLASKVTEIADFCGLPTDIDAKTTHAYRNKFRSGVLETVDHTHLAEMLDTHAGQTARRVLPDWDAAKEVSEVFGQT